MCQKNDMMYLLKAMMPIHFCENAATTQLWVMNEDFTAERQREWARTLYLNEGTGIRDIALKTGASEAAIRQWIAQGGWDGLKRTLLTSRDYQLTQLYKLLEQLTDKMKEAGEVHTKDADLLVKYTAAIKNLDEEVNIPAIVQVGKLFTTWLRRRNAALALQVTDQFDAFIKHRLLPLAD